MSGCTNQERCFFLGRRRTSVIKYGNGKQETSGCRSHLDIEKCDDFKNDLCEQHPPTKDSQGVYSNAQRKRTHVRLLWVYRTEREQRCSLHKIAECFIFFFFCWCFLQSSSILHAFRSTLFLLDRMDGWICTRDESPPMGIVAQKRL